jgi:threonyl-tRNA synthetase
VGKAGYQEVKSPLLIDRKLWEMSGHWENYREHMFVAEVEDEDLTLAVKPMNCPGHRADLQAGDEILSRAAAAPRRVRRMPPLRAVRRLARAAAGARLHPGRRAYFLHARTDHRRDSRVLPAAADDVSRSRLRGRAGEAGDAAHKTRIGGDNIWDSAEAALKDATSQAGVEYALNPGEGAFYGPKLEFVLRDSIGRDWQCGTLQVDFNTADRLGASYIAEDGARHVPVMLHRAVLGSMERFIGVLIEHYAGKFPLWLAPVQAVVATIVSDADSYALEAAEALRAAGLRVETDLRNEKINYKVREHSLAKVPYLLVAGRREAENRTLTLRRLGSDAQENLALTAAIHMLEQEAVPPDLR